MTPRSADYLGPGFALALSVRLLTSALVIAVPLYAVDALKVAPYEAGVYVLLLWVGNALGVAAAVLALRSQSYSSLAGFLLVALSLLGLATGGRPLAPLFMLSAGAGVGLPQPFLSAIMHVGSRPGRPFSGLGLYSTALGVGLVLGPLIAYGAFPAYGFAGVFYALSAVCAVGIAAAALGHRSASIRPKPSPPSPRRWLGALRRRHFARAVAVNLMYSLLLPVFLSYGAIFAKGRFGLPPSNAFLLFTLVFTASVALRLAAVRFEAKLDRLIVLSALLLLLSTLTLGLATSWPLFVLGLLLFSLPHAYVFPIANYYALEAAKDDVMNASYAFQASSALAEFVSPAAAVLLIPWVGVQGLFLAGSLLAAGVLIGVLPAGALGEPGETVM